MYKKLEDVIVLLELNKKTINVINLHQFSFASSTSSQNLALPYQKQAKKQSVMIQRLEATEEQQHHKKAITIHVNKTMQTFLSQSLFAAEMATNKKKTI